MTRLKSSESNESVSLNRFAEVPDTQEQLTVLCPDLDSLDIDYRIENGRVNILPSVLRALHNISKVSTPGSAVAEMTYSRYGLQEEDGSDELVRAIATQHSDEPDELQIRDAIRESVADSSRRIRDFTRHDPSENGSLLANDVSYGWLTLDGDNHLSIQEGEDVRVSDADESTAKSILFPWMRVTQGGRQYIVARTDAAKDDRGRQMPAKRILDVISDATSTKLATCIARARRNIVAAADPTKLMRPALTMVAPLRPFINKWKGQTFGELTIEEFHHDRGTGNVVIRFATPREVYALLWTDLEAVEREDEAGMEYRLSKANLTIHNEQNVRKRSVDLSPKGPEVYKNVAEFGNKFMRPVARQVGRVLMGFMKSPEGEEKRGEGEA